jgi:hypothetical protein
MSWTGIELYYTPGILCCGYESFFLFGSSTFFSDPDLDLDTDPKTNICILEIFRNSVSHGFHVCSGTCTIEKKGFNEKKNIFFSLSSI